MCKPPSCQAPCDLTSASLPSSLPMFALLTWGQHSAFLFLLWKHRTCYCPKTFVLHQWLSPQIFAWLVTSCHSRLTSPERYLIYWSPHLKWSTPPALLLLHLVLFPLSYITVWNHSLFIHVFTAYLLPPECKSHEDRTPLCHVCCYVPNSQNRAWLANMCWIRDWKHNSSLSRSERKRNGENGDCLDVQIIHF